MQVTRKNINKMQVVPVVPNGKIVGRHSPCHFQYANSYNMFRYSADILKWHYTDNYQLPYPPVFSCIFDYRVGKALITSGLKRGIFLKFREKKLFSVPKHLMHWKEK